VDVRRINDILKIVGGIASGVGSIGSALLMLAGLLPTGKVAAILVLIGTAGTGVAAWATRSLGTEYTTVTEAKVKASLVPPPPLGSPAPTVAPPPSAG
jgi:hypothetical protein